MRRPRLIIRPSRAVARLSTDLEGRDFAEQDRLTGEDHAAHAPGKVCARCGRVIAATQTARRRGADEGEWAHDMCPVADE
jgi:hypothetical protein